jgi:drug/metabolite transporter (DMT)-like permease
MGLPSSSPISAPTAGALWMVATVALAALMVAFIRVGAEHLHPLALGFWRGAFGIALVIPWQAARGGWRLPTASFPLHLLRAAFTVLCMLAFFWAVALMPMAEATALTFTTPLFATLGAALFLKERVGARRWAGVVVGFAGALLIVRPGWEGVSFAALLALASALFGAGDWLTLRPLAGREPTHAVVTWLTLLMTPLSLIPALFVWQAPPPESLSAVFLLALAATLGQATATRAFRASEVSFLALFDFLRLVFVAAIGRLLFGEEIEAWTAVGSAIVIAASAAAARGEARRRRAPAIGGSAGS